MLIAHAAQDADAHEPGLLCAVAIAARAGAKLVSVHACADGAPSLELPPASAVLARWGQPEQAVVHERVLHSCCDAVDETLLDALHRLRPDMLIASTHARSGLSRLLFGSVAEGVARNLHVPSLLLPLGGPQLVDASTGEIRLRRVLLPLGGARDAQRTVDAAVDFVRSCGVHDAELVLLHVDDGSPVPEPRVPSDVRVSQRVAQGQIDRTITIAADELQPDLVVMVTHGHDGPADVALASHTERVLHSCRRPLLWVPAAA